MRIFRNVLRMFRNVQECSGGPCIAEELQDLGCEEEKALSLSGNPIHSFNTCL